MLTFLRKLFRLPFPAMSRSDLAQSLIAAQQLSVDLAYKNSMLVHDLRLACLHGLWRRDHPLAAHLQEDQRNQKMLNRFSKPPVKKLVAQSEALRIEFHQT